MATIVGYYSSWKVYSTCKIEEIDPSLCTILLYAFAGLNVDSTIKVLDDWGDIQQQGYKKFTDLKKQNPQLKTLLAVGGWNEGSVNYSNMVSNPDSRRVFINSCLDFIRKYGFDGIDLDWEYPGQRGGKPEDKKNLILLLKEVREEFDKHNYLFTMAVAAGESHIDISYEVGEMSKYLSYILVMTYDLHSHSDGRTGANAPLRSSDNLNVEHCINTWIKRGANPAKVIMGIGGYGQSYTLANSSNHEIGALTTGPGLPGPDSKAAGTLHYPEILAFEKSGWTKEWSQDQQIPFSYHENQWVGYDDVKSTKLKVAFAKKRGLGGVMMWSIDMDDPRGQQGIKFPLLKAINEEL